MANPISVLLIIGGGLAAVIGLAAAVATILWLFNLWFEFCWQFSPEVGGALFFAPVAAPLIAGVFYGGALAARGWWAKR